MLLTTSFFAQDLPYYVSPKGLLVWLPLEGTTFDKSENGNDANGNHLMNTEDRFGKSDKAIYLDGVNSYLTLEVNNQDLMLSDNFTIAMWIYPNFSMNNQYVLAKGDKTSNEFAISTGSGNSICIEKSVKQINNCTTLIKNQWSNITLTIQNNTAKLYINGKLATIYLLETPIFSSPLPYTFGAIFSNGTNTPVQNSRYNGKMDDIAIWNRVLSAEEILLFYKGENK